MSIRLGLASLMNIWLVRLPFEDDTLNVQLFGQALQCVDQESRARITRFYHREDQWRCVVGRLAPRVLLKYLGAEPQSIIITATDTGKPIIKSPSPNVHFNVSHDSNYVAMAYVIDDSRADANIGIDLMKAEIPPSESVTSFASQLSDQLTLKERLHVAIYLHDPPTAALILFKYWTIKEAYTKAIGLGQRFDFTRVEYAPSETGNDRVLVDGRALPGWEFRGFIWREPSGAQYVGMAARQVGVGDTSILWTHLNGQDPDWLRRVSVVELVSQAQPLM